MSLLLLLGRQGSPAVCAIAFSDENGNPLPPLTRVDIFLASPPSAAPVFSGLVGVNSSVSALLYAGSGYRARVYGSAIRERTAFFVAASSLTLALSPCVSPYQTQKNYAVNESANGMPTSIGGFYPRGRLPASALSSSGVAHRLFNALASIFAYFDLEFRTLSAAQRLDASAEGQIDSWARDFIGQFDRTPQESDAAYIARIAAWLQLPFGTLFAVQTVVAAFFAAFPDASTSQDVFDRQSDPTRASRYGLEPGQFAVIEYAAPVRADQTWFLGQSYLGQSTFLSDPLGFTASQSSPYPALMKAVNMVKALGSVPIYIVSTGEPSDLGKWGSPWGAPWGVSSAS